MALTSALFRNDQKLEAAAVSDPAHILPGARGDHVMKIQIALNTVDGASLTPDAIYGQATAAAVLAFKRKRNIVNTAYQTQPDNVVGKMTIAALDAEVKALENRPPPAPPTPGRPKRICGNGFAENEGIGSRISHMFFSPFTQSANVFGVRGVGDNPIVPPDPPPPPVPPPPTWADVFHPLTAAQIARARQVYGESLDYTTIFMSRQLGAFDCPFTLCLLIPGNFGSLIPGVPPGAKAITILNVGTFTPDDDTFIHELAHSWQSQHHSNPRAYMFNSVASQGTAFAQNKVLRLVDPSLRHGDPSHFPFSAYCFKPGTPFGDLAAEQIANSVELDMADIRAHVRGVAKNAVDPENIKSLSKERTDDRRVAGNRFDKHDPPPPPPPDRF